MSEKWQKAEIIAKKVVIVAVLMSAAIAVFVMIPQVLVLLLPFVIAYILSVIASPVTHLFEKLRLPPSLSSVISILLVAAALFGVSALVVNKAVSELYDFSASIPSLYHSVTDTMAELQGAANDAFDLIPDALSPYVIEAIENIGSSLDEVSASIVTTISSLTFRFLKNIPAVLIGVVFSILASYFLIRDKKKVKKAIANILGEDISSKITIFKRDLSSAVFAYVRAQCILMSITFVELFIGLSIMGINYSFLFAIVIALVDAIPVFGTGTILIPWALFSLITGNYTLTIGLCILYAVCLVVRQFLEPKILSTQIGMHPLLTLLSMYIGFRFLGIFGMILGPVVTLIIKNFIHRYHHTKKTA